MLGLGSAVVLLFVAAAFLVVTWIITFRRSLDAGWLVAAILFYDLLASVATSMGQTSGLLVIVLGGLGGLALVALITRRASTKSLDWRSYVPPILFLAVSLLGLVWSEFPDYGWYKLSFLLLRAVVPAVLVGIIYMCHRVFTWWPLVLVGGIYAISVLFFGQETLEYAGRSTLSGINPIWSARASLLLVSLAIAHRGSWVLRTCLITLGAAACLATQSRGPLVALLAALLIWAIGKVRMKRTVLRWTSILVGLTLAFTILVAYPALESYGSVLASERMGVVTDSRLLLTDPTFVQRLELWKRAVELWEESPVVGVGLGGYSTGGERLYPHNLPLEVASELGLMGLAAWVLMIVAMFQATAGNDVLRLLWLQTLLYSMSSGDLAFNWEYVFIGILALFLNAARSRSRLPRQDDATQGPAVSEAI